MSIGLHELHEKAVVHPWKGQGWRLVARDVVLAETGTRERQLRHKRQAQDALQANSSRGVGEVPTARAT